MHLPTTTQILLLSSLLAITASAGPLPPTTLITTATSTTTPFPTPVPIEKKRQVDDVDVTGRVLPSAEKTPSEYDAEISDNERANDPLGVIEEKRQVNNVGAGEIPSFSDGEIVTHDQNPSHDMVFSENIGA